MFSIYVGEDFIGGNSIYCVENRTAEYGRIIVDSNYSGKSYGYKATIAAAKFAEEILELEQLWLEVYEDNVAAITTYFKAGFGIEETITDKTGRKMHRMGKKLRHSY